MSVKDSKDDSGVADTAEDDSIEVTITVTNADEDGTVTLLPAQPQVGVVLTASLADPDGAVSGTTWVWESSADGSTGWTTLNGASSTVTTSSYTPVTADLNKYLRATASYTDPESSGKSANAVSANAVQAAPVTNLEPDFPSTETGARTVAENTAAGEPIGSPVAATDADNDPLTYSFDVPSTAFFTIDSASGQLRTKADLDYETKSSYTVTVSVHDGKNATGGADTTEDDSIEVTITVTDVNEAPEFPSTETGARSVAENTAVGENIGDAVTATDQDSGDTLTYSLGVADTTFFDIVETTGQLQTKAALDYETKDSYTVTVSVGDSKDAAGATDTAEDDSIEVTITVTNAEEDGTVTLSLAWPQVGTELTASLSDPDDDVTGLAWQWASADTATGAFTDIVGAESASYTPVDGDLGKYLQATATYDDGEGSGKSASAVSANATNKAPVFSEDLAARLVDENTVAGTDIGTALTATDADTLTYTLGGTNAAFFSIIDTSGQLQTKEPLNFEDRRSYEVTVIATDPSGVTDTIEVRITVNNLDEAGVVELSTVQPQVGTALTAMLTDLDGEPSLVSWQWARGDSPTGSYSNISSGDSYTPVTADLNKYLRATASYTDPQGSGKSANGVSTNAVQAALGTNSAPVFSADTATRSVEENTAAETDFGTAVTATDADTLTYTLGGTDEMSFDIIPGSGQLQTNLPLDYEDRSSYEVVVTATDPSGESDSITVTITVTNLDEAGTVELSAVQPQVGTALTASLTDLDQDPSGVSWQWARGDSETGPFTNVSSGANPATYTPVAADLDKFLRATASYTDRQGPGKSAVGVSANPVQAEPATNSGPVFSADAATRSVAESAAPGSNIGTPVTATDADADTLTYTLGGVAAASFSIVNTSGQLQTKDSLDYEDTPSYTVTVTATDPSGAADTITVTITVINVDEPGTVELSAVQPQVGTALTATLDDPDGATTGVTWQWARSGTDGSYSNVSSGASYTPAAADVGKFLRATATYTDPQRANKSANGVSANPVRAEPRNNVAPVFSANTATRSVAENAVPESNIGTPVTATDADSDTLTYTLGGNDAGSFSIVDASGQLQTNAYLDYESKSSYAVTVNATDPSGVSDNITVTITVDNLDEAGTVTLSPAQPQVGTALTATLDDPDGATTGVTWQWARSGANGSYSNISSGASYTPVAADVGKFLRATATYTDRQGPGKSAVGVSDNPVQAEPPANSDPSFSAETATRSVNENTPANQNIGAPVAATDANNGDTLTYSLGGDDKASFSIVDTSGQLQTKDALDYETKDSYTVTVSVGDSKDAAGATDTAEDDSIEVTITVTNADEDGTVTLLPAQPQVGTELTASLSDPDGDPSAISWQWARADSATGTFADISGATSASYTPVNDDVEKYLRATASYTDPQGSGKSAAGVSGNAVQADSLQSRVETNAAPEFPSTETGARSVAENTAAGENIGAPVTATDADNDTLTYSLGGTDASSFTLVSTSGQLQTKDALDYETKNSYTVTVSVHDGKDVTDGVDTTVDDTITVTITVTNADEPGTVTLPPGQPRVDTGLTATLADPDGDVSDVTWKWESSSDGQTNWASISGATSETYAPEATDVGKYLQATASYTDPQGSGKSASAVSSDPVLALPNTPPAFSDNTVTRSVAENTAAGQAIGAPATATDTVGDTLTYTLGGDDAASFDIVGSSGQLQTKTALDHETTPSYTVTVTATDTDGATAEVTVTINVTNVNEAPAFADDTATRSITENTAAGQNIGSPVAASDPDRVSALNALTYTLGGTNAGHFTIVSTSGQLQTKPGRDLDYEAKSSYTVTVSVRDGKNASGNTDTGTDDTITVTINVTDRNEPPGKPAVPTVAPASAIGHTTLSVSWSAPSNTGPSISGYGVEYRKKGTGSWLTGNVSFEGTTATINNVIPDTDYEVRVRAKNDEGNGEWSDPGTGKTAVTPVNLQITLTVNYSSASYSVTEGSSRSIAVTLSAPADRALQVPITIANGTAETGDYQVSGLTSNDLSFAPGDSSRSFTLRAVSDSDRDNETVTLGFGNSLPAKVVAGARNTATVSINDDDRITTNSNNNDKGDSDDLPGVLDPRQSVISVSPPANRAPVFTEGVSTTRSVAEHTDRAIYIGEPVTATDADGDQLTYSLGSVVDRKSFAIDEVSGQLITRVPLDFETKPSYTVVVGVSDGRGASDAIVVTINLTDLQEVPITNPRTQAVGKVRPDAETTIETPDGAASVTFPVGSRENSYQVRVDSDASSCGGELPEGALRVSLTVEYFDNWGIQEYDVVLERPATVRLRLNAAELGGVDKVLAAHRRGGFSIYSHSGVAGEWSKVEFMLEDNDQGMITLTARGLRRLNCFAATTDAAAFAPVAQPVTENPTPEPTPRPTDQPTPEVEATPAPTSTAAPLEMTFPRALPVIVPYVPEEYQPTPPAISLVKEVAADSGPEAPETPPAPQLEKSGNPPLWSMLMMIAGITLMASGGGLYLLARRRRWR